MKITKTARPTQNPITMESVRWIILGLAFHRNLKFKHSMNLSFCEMSLSMRYDGKSTVTLQSKDKEASATSRFLSQITQGHLGLVDSGFYISVKDR
jgi:hypothetical protein